MPSSWLIEMWVPICASIYQENMENTTIVYSRQIWDSISRNPTSLLSYWVQFDSGTSLTSWWKMISNCASVTHLLHIKEIRTFNLYVRFFVVDLSNSAFTFLHPCGSRPAMSYQTWLEHCIWIFIFNLSD